MTREVMTVAGHVQIFVGIEAELTPPWVGEKWRISFVHPLYKLAELLMLWHVKAVCKCINLTDTNCFINFLALNFERIQQLDGLEADKTAWCTLYRSNSKKVDASKCWRLITFSNNPLRNIQYTEP